MNDPLRDGIIKRIHVNQHNIRHNKNYEDKKPVITIKTSSVNTKCFRVKIEGSSELIYNNDKPLPCGARVWMETTAKVTVIN